MELSPELKRIQKVMRKNRKETAEAQGISEGLAISRMLSPTMEGFLRMLRIYAPSDDEPTRTIDYTAVWHSWPNQVDAQHLLEELELRDLVEENENGKLRISALGAEALTHLIR